MITNSNAFNPDVKESSFTHIKLKATHTDTFSGSFSNSCASLQFAYLYRPALPLPVYSACTVSAVGVFTCLSLLS